MALNSTLTLRDRSNTACTFSLIKTNSDGTARIDTATPLSTPTILNIKHSVTGKGALAVDRHLIQVVKSVSATPSDVQVVANLTLAVPRNIAISKEDVYDLISQITSVLQPGFDPSEYVFASSNVDALLRGES